jgi:anti-anti-sigma regulatory factor
MDLRVQGEGPAGVLHLNGDLTINRADELRGALMGALETVEHLVINFEAVGDVDLTCLQLLCSAHRMLTLREKGLTLAGTGRESMLRAAENAGFMKHRGCVHDANKGCLWLREDV